MPDIALRFHKDMLVLSAPSPPCSPARASTWRATWST